MPGLIDLTGQKFGLLTVLERAENKGKQTQWLCECQCGNKKIVYATNLRRGLTTSCGCYRKEKLSMNKLQDLTGLKFGKLTVIGLHHYDETKRQYYWSCVCECGGQTIVYGGHLKDGHTKSCGCVKSLGEEKIAKILRENNIPFQKEYVFKDCRGLSNGVLRFDFAIFDEKGLSYLIEYDGIQHDINFNTTWDKNGGFENRQKHDQIKDQYCKQNNIPLLRIKSFQYKTLTYDDLKKERVVSKE